MSACPAACVGFQKVGGIAVTCKYHVACLICDDGVGMCGGIVEKLMDHFLCFALDLPVVWQGILVPVAWCC